MLDHEKLDVYQRAIEFVAYALRIAECLPRGQAPLGGTKSLLVRVVEMLSKMC